MRIGVDIGGTRIKAGLVDKGNIIKKVAINTPKEKDKIIEYILFVIELLNGKNADFIGIGCPGPADYERGVIGNTQNIALKGVNVKDIVKKRFRKEVIAENDAACFALGESIRLGKKNLIGLTLGTGVGGGIIIDGKLYKGKGNAGELGHCTIKFDGKPGLSQGELEAYVSAKAIKRDYGKKPEELKSKQAWNEIGEKLGAGVANIANAFDPETISIGGGIASAFDLFRRGMEKEIKKRALSRAVVIKGDENSGIIGAASLY